MTTPLIELYVMGIALDSRTGTPIVVLNDKDNRRALPIWIGTAEASAIIRQLENIKSTRPMTHDLILNLIEQLNYTVARIEINDLSSDTYYASVFLEPPKAQPKTKLEALALDASKGPQPLILDARPSDAIAIALRSQAPIFASTSVMSEGTISTDQARDEQEAQEFREFLRDIKPSDFQKFNLDEGSDQ